MQQLTEQKTESAAVIHSAEPDTLVPIDGEIDVIGAELSERAHRRGRDMLRGVVMTAAVLGAIVVATRVLMSRESWLEFITAPWGIGLIMLAATATPVCGLIDVLRSRRRTREATQRLAGEDDVLSVPALVDVLTLEDDRSRREAMDALTRLLPRLKASDAELLSTAQYAKLNSILGRRVENPFFKELGDLLRPASRRAVDLRVAILAAYQQVGDPRALPLVRKLASESAVTPGEKRIKQAAIDCIPFLESIETRWRSARTLLRPSEACDAEETLLRAAAGSSINQPAKLLRATGETDLAPLRARLGSRT